MALFDVTSIVAKGTFTCALLAAVCISAAAACEPEACTPEQHGLGGATLVTPRELPGRAATPGDCKPPRTEVISTEAELRRLYEELGLVTSSDDGTSHAGSGEYPSVDFSREHVIVREGSGSYGISWVAAKGETGFLGLLSCLGPTPASCVVDVIAVPASITRVETRTCDPVRCGRPSGR